MTGCYRAQCGAEFVHGITFRIFARFRFRLILIVVERCHFDLS
jgi:hypothetical protein